MKNNYSISIFWLSVLAVAVIGYMLLSVQNITRASFVKNEGIEVSANTYDDTDIIKIGIVNQNNNAWAMKIMCSDIKMRICEYGSQLCCISSVFQKFGIVINPDRLYDKFESDGLYPKNPDGMIAEVQYEIIDEQYKLKYERPDIHTDYTFNSKTIAKLVSEGTPVLLRTKHPLIARYWVVVIGIQDGEFVIMDPLTQEYSVLSQYDNKAYEIIYFTE